MKKLLVVLVVVLVLLVGATAAVGGYAWYYSTHFFVEDAAYKLGAEELDLRGQEISEAHYAQVRSQLPNAEILWDVPFQGGRVSSDAAELTVNTLTESDLEQLRYFPSLKTVHAQGCRDYELLNRLASSRPDLTVEYSVDLGGVTVAPGETALTLEDGSYDYELLLENARYLEQLTSVALPKTSLSAEQLQSFREAYPAVAVDYTLTFRGQEMEPDITNLDLSDLTPGEVSQVAKELAGFPNLQYVELMNGEGKSDLSLLDVKTLQDAAPNATFHYSYTFYKTTVSTTDTEIQFRSKNINIDDEEELRQLLDILKGCKRIVFEYCWKLPNDMMAQIREDYRDRMDVVWGVSFSDGGYALTDVEVLRIVYDLTDKNSVNLKYLENVRYIDMGHNETLFNVDFVAYMPKLEAMIISGAPIKSLEPFRNCKELKFLELSNCMYIEDLSPLAECTELEMLNISYTSVTDLTPIDDLKLTHLMASHNKLEEEEEQRYMELHPDCLVTLEGNEYGVGWRYVDSKNSEKTQWYARLWDVFGYPNANNQTGWYAD